MSKEDFIPKAIEWAEGKSAENLKVNMDGYEKPNSFVNQSTSEEVVPDITFTSKYGTKNYTDIALKSENSRKLVTRWKLLSTMAEIKKGKFFLMAPKGHKMFTQRLVDQYNINAKVLSI